MQKIIRIAVIVRIRMQSRNLLMLKPCHETTRVFSLDLWILALSSLLSINIASWAALFEKVINSKCPLLD